MGELCWAVGSGYMSLHILDILGNIFSFSLFPLASYSGLICDFYRPPGAVEVNGMSFVELTVIQQQ